VVIPNRRVALAECRHHRRPRRRARSPVLDHHGVPVGGISVSALAFDLDRAKVRACAPLLITAARDASHALGLPNSTPPTSVPRRRR